VEMVDSLGSLPPSGSSRVAGQTWLKHLGLFLLPLFLNFGFFYLCYSLPDCKVCILQLSATDISAQASMKGAAKCDNHCELQNSVNQWKLERALHSRDIPGSMPASVLVESSCRCVLSWHACVSVCHDCNSTASGTFRFLDCSGICNL
jgi:ssDNA-binding Zn-finger/Zn-ribbon topoisomerase 1